VAGLAGLAAATLLLALAPGGRAARAGDDTGYLGASSCVPCHGEAHAAWSGSSHAHTFERATPENMPAAVTGGETVVHTPGTTRFHAEDGRFFAETVGPDGEARRYPLTHVVGRMRVRMFVTTFEDGRQQVLPAMLEVPRDHWFDYTKLIFGTGGTDWDTPPIVRPGDPSFWTGAVRSWDARCARCHVSGYQPRRPGTQGGPRYEKRALGVDCESCHGPGAAHVAFREERREGKDPILRFGDLAHERALGVCLQCHMESEVVERGFLPGMDVFEFRDPTLLVDPERVDASGRPLELIYDGLPFSVSRCVQEGKLTCITCHDPHGSPHASQMRRLPEDNANCTGCHAEIGADVGAHTRHAPAGSGSQCVSCHMPFLRIERGHGVVADHSISTPTFALESDRLAENACVWCHAGGLNAPGGVPEKDEDALKAAFQRWWPDARPPSWAVKLGAARLGRENASSGLLEVLRDRDNPRLVRASAAELLGRHAQRSPLALLAAARDADSLVRRRAVAALASLEGASVDAALMRALEDPSRAVRVAAARAALEGWRRIQENRDLLAAVLPVLAADAAEGPNDDMRWFRLGAARSIAGQTREALAAYERVLELDLFADNVEKAVARLKAKLAGDGN
jgi:predicted CXXCH cytochrome family protein